ncbi:hypothetical protein LSTR_LSTR015760, partial [Laodelphax striatellus]
MSNVPTRLRAKNRFDKIRLLISLLDGFLVLQLTTASSAPQWYQYFMANIVPEILSKTVFPLFPDDSHYCYTFKDKKMKLRANATRFSMLAIRCLPEVAQWMRRGATVSVSFQIMEELIDKLKALNYDEEFLEELKMRPIHNHYFALQTNAGEQFFLFTALSAWLLRKLGLKFEQPQEFDAQFDLASILDSTGSLPRPPAEVEDEDSNGEDDYELLLERVEEEMAGEDSEEDEDNLLHIDDLHNGVSAHKIMELQKPEEILESNTNLEEWHLELERVLPHLKVTIKS